MKTLIESRTHAVLIIIVTIMAMAKFAGQTDAQGMSRGEELFSAKGCIGCHTFDGSGGKSGPDLKGAAAKWTFDDLIGIINNPSQYNLAMPPMGLTHEDAESIAIFLGAEAPSGEVHHETQPVPSETTPPDETHLAFTEGDVSRGEKLFTGELKFEKGGLSCISCHASGGNGALGGGTIGPDLTGIESRMGVGLGFALKTITWPTMLPLYKDRPLTDQEIADLMAYFASISPDTAKQKNTHGTMAEFGIAFTLILIALSLVIWRDRSAISDMKLKSR